MKTFTEMLGVVSQVEFSHHPSLGVRFKNDGPGQYFVQLVDSDLPDSFGTGRKWRISAHMTKSEIVGTLWKAYMTWLEHEARESFLYDGRAVYGPHLDVDVLWRVAGQAESYEYRS